MVRETFRWGIMGTGSMARKMTRALSCMEDAVIVCVGSRDTQRANAFAHQFDIPVAHNDYELVARDDDVDIVYAATTNNLHAENACTSLRSGKAVLCEKPLGLNQEQVLQIIETARESAAFAMEGMWFRFLPVIQKIRTQILDGVIGKVSSIQSDFSFGGMSLPQRLLHPKFGGGALLDVGVYPVAFATMVMGRPTDVEQNADFGSTGVDLTTRAKLLYADGAQADISCSIEKDDTSPTIIEGSDGCILIEPNPWYPKRITTRRGRHKETEEIDGYRDPYRFEIEEVHNCLREDKDQSDTMPLSFSLDVIDTVDQIKVQQRSNGQNISS